MSYYEKKQCIVESFSSLFIILVLEIIVLFLQTTIFCTMKILYYAIIINLISLTSLAQKRSSTTLKKVNHLEYITKKWKVDTVALKITLKEDLLKILENEEDKENLAELMMPKTIEAIGSITLNFKKDGHSEMSFMSNTGQGKWFLSNDGKMITIYERGQKQEIEVLELNKNKLIIYMTRSKKEKLRIPLIPAS